MDIVQAVFYIKNKGITLNEYLQLITNKVDGVLKLAKTSLPKGKMNITMNQYQDVVDLLVPEDFMISKSYIKKIIAKATMASLNKVASNDDALEFEVNFSDNFSASYNGSIHVNGANLSLVRETSGHFDSTSFDSTSYNRGWITIQYVS